MKKFFHLYLLIFLSFNCNSSCRKEGEDPTKKDYLTSKEPLWVFNNLMQQGGGSPIHLNNMPYYENIIVLGANMDDKRAIYGIDVNSGKSIWKRNDFGSATLHNIYVRYSFVETNKLYTLDSYDEILIIDINTGNLISQRKLGFEVATMIPNEINLFICNKGDTKTESIHKVNKSTLNNEGLFLSPYTNNILGSILPNISFGITGGPFLANIVNDNKGKDELLVFSFSAFEKDNLKLPDAYLSCYNITQSKWQWSKINIPFGHVGGVVATDENKVYAFADKTFYAFDIKTGEQVWKTDFDNDLGIGIGFILYQNKVIFNDYDWQAGTVCLDATTGKKLWNLNDKNDNMGAGPTSSPIQCLNGVAYFSSEADGRLYAIDIEEGKILWRLNDPADDYKNPRAFAGDIAVIPPSKEGEKGKVVVTDYYNAYCFEAAR